MNLIRRLLHSRQLDELRWSIAELVSHIRMLEIQNSELLRKMQEQDTFREHNTKLTTGTQVPRVIERKYAVKENGNTKQKTYVYELKHIKNT